MTNFLARVELHSATYQDYETLHNAMATRGFNRFILGDDGVSYWLPTGTYVATNTDWHRSTALEKAKAAAAQTSKKSSIIVADRTASTWTGLERKA